MSPYIRKQIRQLLIVIAALIALDQTVYIVDETERAVILRFGEAVYDVTEAGPHLRWPYPFHSVRKLEKRLVKYDGSPREIITADKKTGMVDLFSYYRITDGLQFFRRIGNMTGAYGRVDDIVYSETRNAMGRRSFEQILVTERENMMDGVTEFASRQMAEYGFTTNLVRMNRFELPGQNKPSVYGRMNAERQAQAMQYRSEGNEQAQMIRSATEREAKIILADAQETAKRNWGQGDAEATRLYNEAYGRDPEFFRFYRSLLAAEESLKNNGDVRYFLKGTEPHLRALLGR